MTGCGRADVNAVDTGRVLVTDFEVTPDLLVLGEQPMGHTASDVVSVVNTGETEVIIAAVELREGSDLSVTVDAPVVQPGSSGAVRVAWTPSRPGLMQDEVSLLVGPSREELEEVEITVRGNGHGPVLSMSVGEYDFEQVPIGCVRELKVTLSNSGNEPLVVDGVALDADPAFTLRPLDPLPWTIAPFGSAQLTAVYAPTERGGSLGAVTVSSADGARQVRLTGEGTVDGEKTVRFSLAERKPTTILIHTNEVVIEGTWGWYAAPLEEALPTFFEALLETRQDFRVGFVWNVTGDIDSKRFIDNSYSAADATREALAQMAPGAEAGDNDRSYTTLLAAIEANEDWLFEDEYWESSRLSLIAMNRDAEQSGGSFTTYVSMAQSYKDDPDDVLFHAIAGPPPSGCGMAESFRLFKDAVDKTGGVFLSICEPTWYDHMRKLVAAAVVGGRDVGGYRVALTGTPLASSIRVEVDGRNLPANWRYDPPSNAVVFDPDYAIAGREIAVTYEYSTACGGG